MQPNEALKRLYRRYRGRWRHSRLPMNCRKHPVVAAILLMIQACAYGADTKAKFLIPDDTRSPDGRYGVTVPVFALTKDDKTEPANKLVEIHTGRVLAVIHADPGYDRALNYHEIVPSRWSPDSSLLLWEVDGKWFSDALVLLRLENRQVAWQRDLLKLAQQAILARTRKAAPEKYAAAKKANEGNGSAYPDGFSIDVQVLGALSLPLRMRAVLTSDPKAAGAIPKLESYLDATIDDQGKFNVNAFSLGHAASRHFLTEP
jgi:hypothetical protein